MDCMTQNCPQIGTPKTGNAPPNRLRRVCCSLANWLNETTLKVLVLFAVSASIGMARASPSLSRYCFADAGSKIENGSKERTVEWVIGQSSIHRVLYLFGFALKE